MLILVTDELETMGFILSYTKQERNGYAEQSNPFEALQQWSRQPTASPNGRDRPRLVLSLSKQANAFGKAKGYADVGAENRKVKVLAEVRSYGRRRNSY